MSYPGIIKKVALEKMFHTDLLSPWLLRHILHLIFWNRQAKLTIWA